MEAVAQPEISVAKKKSAGDELDSSTIQISCTKGFSRWVHELARFDERQISAMVRRALRDYADKVGFKEPTPE